MTLNYKCIMIIVFLLLTFLVSPIQCFSRKSLLLKQNLLHRRYSPTTHLNLALLDDFSITLQIPDFLYETFTNGLNILRLKDSFFSLVFQLGFMKSMQAFLSLSSIFGFFTFILVLSFLNKSNKSSPYDENKAIYDVKRAEQFYRTKPHLVLGRLLKIASLAIGFNLKLVRDWRFDELTKNQEARAEEALAIISQLGPTFIKLGQALSIRTDLIPPVYAKSLKKLQDAVPSFSSAIAKKIICKELGITDLSEKFRTFSNEPVAAASIGQVYRAKLLNGRDVAVKVQRPNILPAIGLDLYVLRVITPWQVIITNKVNGMKTVQSDLEQGYSLVDEWGKGLVAEVDYQLEARNTKQFSLAMKKRGLDAVISPGVIEELCTSKVMVTEWVDGTRLDRDASADVPRLCSLAVNAYLTMLLDTGVLHCDPHPGNLLRTKDGRLCILDWGMTISLPTDLQYGLLEFIAHCNSGNFSELAEDFVKLGATPPDKVEEVRKSGIPEGLAFIMKQLSAGGGPSQLTSRLRTEFKAKYGDLSDVELGLKAREGMITSELDTARAAAGLESADINGVTGVLEMMSKRNRDIFKLPAYMLYVARAFSTLEGIGLSIDKNYSILQECYPYLAKRLMTDNSPRSRQALKGMLYQDGKISANKLIEFSDGFASYTASTTSIDTQGEGSRKAQEAFTDLLLDNEGNLMQELLIDGVTQFTDSLMRVSIEKAKLSPGGKLAKMILKAPKTLADFFVPKRLKALTLPLTLPYDTIKAVVNMSEHNENDEENVKSVKLIWNNIQPKVRSQLRKFIADTTKPRIPFFRALSGRTRNRSKSLPLLTSKSTYLDLSSSTSTSTTNNDDIISDKDKEIYNIPLPIQTSNKIRERLGTANKLNKRIPVVMRLSRQLGVNVLSQAANRLEDSKNYYASLNEELTNHNNKNGDIDKDLEIELLMTESLSFFGSATVKSIANILDKPNKNKTEKNK